MKVVFDFHRRFVVGFVLLDLSFYVYCFIDRCLYFCPFSFGHCGVCPLIYGVWLSLWYLQTLVVPETVRVQYIRHLRVITNTKMLRKNIDNVLVELVRTITNATSLIIIHPYYIIILYSIFNSNKWMTYLY